MIFCENFTFISVNMLDEGQQVIKNNASPDRVVMVVKSKLISLGIKLLIPFNGAVKYK